MGRALECTMRFWTAYTLQLLLVLSERFRVLQNPLVGRTPLSLTQRLLLATALVTPLREHHRGVGVVLETCELLFWLAFIQNLDNLYLLFTGPIVR